MRLAGTLGVLLVAKERALLDQLGPELDRSQAFGVRLAPAVRGAALDLAGETG